MPIGYGHVHTMLLPLTYLNILKGLNSFSDTLFYVLDFNTIDFLCFLFQSFSFLDLDFLSVAYFRCFF